MGWENSGVNREEAKVPARFASDCAPSDTSPKRKRGVPRIPSLARRAGVEHTLTESLSRCSVRIVRSRPRGLTLMELLVVVAVMVILLGAALPLLKIGLAGRRTREVSRQLGTYVELAKSASAETGRESGLILQVDTLPENGLPYVSQLFLAETPRPYAGDIVSARATIMSANTARFNDVASLPQLTYADSQSLPFLVRPGDRIKFDYRGILYNITAVNADYTIVFSGLPSPPVGVSLPYQIFRRPEKSSSAPMQLSSGAVIDLSMSGFGLAEESIFDKTTVSGVISEVESVAILFSPSGDMTRVLVNRIQTDTNASPATVVPETKLIIPTGTLHLLIGGIDGVLLDDIANVNVGDDLETNIENPDNLWVSIGHQSGRATTAENGWTQGSPLSMPLARQFAQSSEAMGGR